MTWWLGWAWLGIAHAGPELSAEVHGDIKAFFVGSFPYDHVLFTPVDPGASTPGADELALLCGSPDPTETLRALAGDVDAEPPTPSGSGSVDARLKVRAEAGPLQWVFHHAVTGTAPNGAGGFGGVGTGVGRTAPEALPLTWVGANGPGLRLQGRTDRLFFKLSVPSLDITLGRQAISFGHGLFFTPMDLVSPFFPTTIDQEYKPGVDALRVDAYVGMSAFTALVAYSGQEPLPDATAIGGAYDPLRDTTVALQAQTTVGVTDLGAFYGLVSGDHVVGLTTASSVGPVGIHADATVTVPEDEPVFFRGVAGLVFRPFATTTVSAEFYVQTLGASNASEYLATQLGDRFGRGELWLAGRYYLGLSLSQEIQPTLLGNLAVIANVADPSAFIAPSLAWSVASNAEVGVGAYFGVGARPEDIDPYALAAQQLCDPSDTAWLSDVGVRSEFGTYPHAAFVQVKTYF